CLTTVRVPSPLEANAYLRPGSNAAASVPAPVSSVATIFPEVESTTTIFLFPQTENKRFCFGSSASPEGSSQPSSFQRFCAFQLRSEEHTSELQSPYDLVCRLLLEKKKNKLWLQLFRKTIDLAPWHNTREP